MVAGTDPVVAIRLAWWAWSACWGLERSLRTEGIDAVDEVAAPPPAPARHRRTVTAAVRLAGASCLVRSAVLRRWDDTHDRPRSLVVGVRRNEGGSVAAHAWLDGERSGTGFVELHRRPPA